MGVPRGGGGEHLENIYFEPFRFQGETKANIKILTRFRLLSKLEYIFFLSIIKQLTIIDFVTTDNIIYNYYLDKFL